MNFLFAALTGYLCGSIPTAYLIGRVFYRINIFEHGSKNMGSTNVYRVLGKKPFAATLLIDILKGMAAVYLTAAYFASPPETLFLAAAAALCGHTLSFWVKFKGGKGVATGLGVFLALATKASVASLGVFLVTLFASGMVSLGSILAAASLPAFIFHFQELGPAYTPFLTAFSAIIATFIIYKHKTNILRILKGEELKIGLNPKKDKEQDIEEVGT